MLKTVILKLTLLLTVPLALMIVMVQAQPVVDDDLWTGLLDSADCAPPCFIGIRPGDMSAGTALSLLESHSWVRKLNIMDHPISWEWSGAQPAWIDDAIPGHIITARFIATNREDGLTNLYFQARLTLADIYMLLGQPDRSWFRVADPRLGIQPEHTVYYADYHLQVTSQLRCPLRMATVWRAPAIISFVNVPAQAWQPYEPAAPFPDYPVGWWHQFPVC